VIVTIDGPAGTGKSSVAHALALRLGLDFLDTGAMYRAVTLAALREGVDLRDEPSVAALATAGDIDFDFTSDPPTLLAFGRPLGPAIRSAEVSAAVSIVAAHPAVRQVLVARQRALARAHRRLVTEGRDQGSVAFPGADLKFYLDASPRIRAERRAAQLRRGGQPADLEEILLAIVRRDEMDMRRAEAPLTCPPDAVRVDTGRLGFEEVVDELARIARARVGHLVGVEGNLP